MQQLTHFLSFKTPVDGIPLPERFTFPFYYEPHPIAAIAVRELQDYLEHAAGWDERFGVSYEKKGLVIGKMFGVLVVQNAAGETGYLAAFSGKLTAEHPGLPFVPPVFDLHTDGRFFLEGEEQLNAMNRRIDELEQSAGYIAAKTLVRDETALSLQQIEDCKQQIRDAKAARKVRRTEAVALPETEQTAVIETLRQESLREQYFLKDLTKVWKARIEEITPPLERLQQVIDDLKEERKKLSAGLQQRLFENYTFLDQSGNRKSLLDIFDVQPPSGAGECTAPKLLQYAFKNNLLPVALAEFWWGQPPGSDIRKHGHIYPACRGKCEPILTHMLNGIPMDPNPVLVLLAEEKTIETLWEDDYLLVIHKPEELLSIPGGAVQDSVETRMWERYPNATGPLIVDRLDMSTSGLMVVAKTKNIHEHIQRQFLKRTVKKRYVALLDGTVEGEEGIIELPLIVDADDRPRQMVSFEHGRPARTRWKVVERRGTQTLMHFFPETGRTHQLRVHAAHPLGLNAPIVGDELYGEKADRLYLHAEELEFMHPVTKAPMRFEHAAPF